MESVISLSEMVGVKQAERLHVYAKADAAYDQAKGRVFVSLSSFVRPLSPRAKGHQLRPTWLPALEHVTADLPRDQVVDFARAAFRDWLWKVRAAMPAEQSAA